MNHHLLAVISNMLMHIFFFLLIYAFTSYALYLIAVRLGTPHPWFACIPFAREWLLVRMAEKSWKWFVVLLIPIVNIVASFIVWGIVARKVDRSVWLGRAMIFPIVNIVFLAALAFGFNWKDAWELLGRIVHKIRAKEVSKEEVVSVTM